MASTLIPDTGVAEEPLDPGDDAWKGQPVALAVVAAMEAATKAVVAICVVLVPTLAVGAVGVPVRVGLASGALCARTPSR
jgi:hypothetical protein